MNELKIVVAGSRFFNDKAFVYKTLDKYIDFLFEPGKKLVIVDGGAKGVDTLAHQYAVDNGFETKTVLANWDENGKSAGAIRNAQMADESNILIAFYSGTESRGTKNMIETACRKGLEVHIIPITVEKRDDFKKNTDFKQKNSFNKNQNSSQKRGFSNDKQKGRKY